KVGIVNSGLLHLPDGPGSGMLPSRRTGEPWSVGIRQIKQMVHHLRIAERLRFNLMDDLKVGFVVCNGAAAGNRGDQKIKCNLFNKQSFHKYGGIVSRWDQEIQKIHEKFGKLECAGVRP